MTLWGLSGVLLGASLFAGFLGSLTGLGGGVVIIPLLTIVMGMDIRYAIGALLVSVIATTLGALGGAFLALLVPTSVIAVVFGLGPSATPRT